MIHELTTLEIKVFSNAKVYAALQERLPAAGGTLVGAFNADIGDLSRVAILPWWAVITPLTLTAILPAMSLATSIRRRHWTAHGRCRNCGYDLRATPDRCPECGDAPSSNPTRPGH